MSDNGTRGAVILRSKKNKKYILKSLVFFKDVKYKLIVIAIFNILVGIIGFILPILEANFIISITNALVTKVVLIAFILLGVKVLEQSLWHLWLTFWRRKVRANLLFSIRKYLMDNVFELKLSNFDTHSTGTFQERVKTDPQTVVRMVNGGQHLLTQCLTKIGVLVYIFCINWMLGIIYLVGISIVALIDNRAQEVSKQKNKITRASDERVNSILSEIIRGIRDIKLLNFKNTVKNKIGEELDMNNHYLVEKQTYDSIMGRYKSITLYVTVLLVVIVGIYFVDAGVLTSANLIVLYLYKNDVFSLMENFSNLRNHVKEYELAVERIFDLCDENKYPKESYGKRKIRDFKGQITFENVSFGYNSKNLVLNDLSFTIKPNDTVALVGFSGSGKTTILNLITKSYDVKEGKILFDGIDIKELDEQTIRKNVSIITQSPYIFNMSIKDNLMLVKPNVTRKEMDEVCKKACFYDFVMSLPDKYDTIIGEGGLNLSGGQKQRLAIARSLLKDCKILLFDEATSALDNITQNEIQESINNISKDYTIIIVAHRLSTIMNCNKIYMLDKGQIVDSGTHKQLLENNKVYQKLYNAEAKRGDI